MQFGGRCTCGPLGYFATVADPITDDPVFSPDFAAVSDAQEWQRAHAPPIPDVTQLTAPVVRFPETNFSVKHSPSGSRLGTVIDTFLEAVERGQFHDEFGEPFSRDKLRELRGSLGHADSALGTTSIQDIGREDVQALLDHLQSVGLSAEFVASIADALRLLYEYAIPRGLAEQNPAAEFVPSKPGLDAVTRISTHPAEWHPVADTLVADQPDPVVEPASEVTPETQDPEPAASTTRPAESAAQRRERFLLSAIEIVTLAIEEIQDKNGGTDTTFASGSSAVD